MTGSGRARASCWLVLGLALLSCRPGKHSSRTTLDTTGLAARESRLSQELARPDSGPTRSEPLARWIMPPHLTEISGLALTPDGRLFAHNDETGRVSEVDYRRGTIVKQFMLGKGAGVKADFEGITVTDDAMYLLASNGTLYEFREGNNGEQVDYNVHDTHLSQECEFEGVAYDPAIQSLLLACKHVHTKRLKGSVVIYRWKLQKDAGPRISELSIPLEQVIGSYRWSGFHPSDITVDPSTGHYVIIASLEKALLELTPSGEVVRAGVLPGAHPMAEGVAITKDHILLISDESVGTPGAITLYRWP